MASTVGNAARSLRDDRFLIGILVGIGLLLALALAAIVLLRGTAQELPATTPGGATQRFLQAAEGQDYDLAYAYLSDTMVDKPTREQFARAASEGRAADQAGTRLRIERETVSGDTAIVVVEVTHYTTSGPFFGGGEWTVTETFTLRREAEVWRITSLPYRYWPPQEKR